MRFGAIIYILGYGGGMLAITMLMPLLLSIGMDNDVHARNFTIGFFLTAFVSGAMILVGRAARKYPAQEIELFLIMVLVWAALPLLASVPFTGALQVFGLSDAYFEAVSALTTSGGSVMKYPELEVAPILLWRALLAWLGGLWMLVFAVAVLASSGIGGIGLSASPLLQLHDKASLSWRLGQPLRLILPIYASLTALGIIAVLATGGGVFDTICIVLSAISSTGFVTHSDGVTAQFNLVGQLFIAIISFAGALSAPVLVALGVGKRLQNLSRDSELRVFIALILVYGVISAAVLTDVGLVSALMQAMSLFSTTGFDFVGEQALLSWPVVWVMAPAIIGGMKVLRILTISKGIGNEFAHLAYPSSVHPMSIGGRRLEAKDLMAIWAYAAVFLMFLGGGILVVGLLGVGLADSWPLVLSALSNNLAITGYLDIATQFGYMSAQLQIFLAFLMVAGRVELLILMVFLTPSFWRHLR
jgi:trk system potassium uptake protein